MPFSRIFYQCAEIFISYERNIHHCPKIWPKKISSTNILLRRGGIWNLAQTPRKNFKTQWKIWKLTRRSRMTFQIFQWVLKFFRGVWKPNSKSHLSAEGCLWLTSRHEALQDPTFHGCLLQPLYTTTVLLQGPIRLVHDKFEWVFKILSEFSNLEWVFKFRVSFQI